MGHRNHLDFAETIMGSSLHNKIPLGRSTVLDSRRVQVALVFVACLGIALAWLALRVYK
jgi:hypothetical protein